MRLLITLLITFFLLFINGCGYKPSSIYTKRALGERIYADVKIDLQEPENTVLIKDAMNEAIVSKFKAKITTLDRATSKIYLKLKDIEFIPIQYDKNGYIVRYKIVVKLHIDYTLKNSQKREIGVTGYYDFLIEPDSIISDKKRFEAIKFASLKALDEFTSKVSIIGFREF